MNFFLPEATSTWGITMVGSPAPLIWAHLGIINLIAFLMMWSDKRRSKREGARRISEKALFLPVLLGGALGGVLGMRAFRHKTRRWYFRFGFPALLVLQLAGFCLLLWKFCPL